MTGDALEIANHGQHALAIGNPAQCMVRPLSGKEINRNWVAVEVGHDGTQNNVEPFVAQGRFEQIRPRVDGRQDGEMGHEPDARFDRP